MERFPLGTPVEVEMTKWGRRPHWEYSGTYLGADERGEWVAFPAGTHNRRPGKEFDSSVDLAMLVPSSGAYLAGFLATGSWCDLYIDIVTPAQWEGTVLTAIDLDLDVIRAPDGTVSIEDEDEFEEHQLVYGYPPEIITLAEESAEAVFAAVSDQRPPFDGSHRRWLEAVSTPPDSPG